MKTYKLRELQKFFKKYMSTLLDCSVLTVCSETKGDNVEIRIVVQNSKEVFQDPITGEWVAREIKQ